MLVDDESREVCNHSGQHQVKDYIMSVGHFEDEDCRSKGCPRQAGKKPNHAGQYEQVCIRC